MKGEDALLVIMNFIRNIHYDIRGNGFTFLRLDFLG